MSAASNKYATIAPETIARIREAIEKRYPQKLVEHELKSQLHQMWGAYFTSRPNFAKLTNRIKEAAVDAIQTKEVLKEIMLIHQSTKERIPILNEFYKEIFNSTGTPKSILEHGCGFNPLTLPWMDLPSSTKYTAYDIDREEITFLNEALKYAHVSATVQCELKDIYNYEGAYADIIFMLKIIPLLEHQKKHSTEEIIRAQNCKFLVVSFPTASLSGGKKGMQQTYTNNFESLLEHLGWKNVIRKEFQTEIVYIINRGT